MLGTQMLGLAALCAAVGILVARLTLRRQRPEGGRSGT
jgi:ABC-type Fe3+ transport system permease subunit